MTDIGRAGMVMKGDYNSASTYETLDAVSYSNGLYIAKQNVPAGTVPTNTTYWQCAVDAASIYAGEPLFQSSSSGTTQAKLNEIYAYIAGADLPTRKKIRLGIFDGWTYNFYRSKSGTGIQFSQAETFSTYSSVVGISLDATNSAMYISQIKTDGTITIRDASQDVNSGILSLYLG